MRFRFPLQTILDLRGGLEHQEEIRLRFANQQVHKVQHRIEQIDHYVLDCNGLLAQCISEGTTGAEILLRLDVKDSVQSQRQALQRELIRLEQIREKQQNIYQEMRRQRETLESLRDSRLREYKRETTRQRQRILDDLFLSGMTHSRHS